MKKILLSVLLLSALTAAHAQNRWTVGVRVGAMFGAHELNDEFISLYGSESEIIPEPKINFIISAYGAYTFFGGLSLQLELDFMINQRIDFSILNINFFVENSYGSLDIPILLRYSFFDKPLLGVEAGPYISIPLGKLKNRAIQTDDHTNDTRKYDIVGPAFGIACGIFAAYPLGPGRIIGNARFIFDFNMIETNESVWGDGTSGVFFRRGTVITLGYEFSF